MTTWCVRASARLPGASTRREEMDMRRSQAIEMAVETFDALVSERGDSGKIWASVLKEAIKRRKPDFNETWYGFRAFGNLLEEAQARGLLEFGRDEKSGAYVYRQGGSTPARPERVERIDMAVQPALQPPAPQSREVLQADDVQEPRREPRRRSRGGRRATQPQSMDSAEQPSSEPAAVEPPPREQDEQPADPPSGTDPGAGAPKPRSRRPRKPAAKLEG
jgi:hypothetical protein